MAINAGENTVQDLYWGADRVKRVYLGGDIMHRITFNRESISKSITIERGVDVVDFNTELEVIVHVTVLNSSDTTTTYDANLIISGPGNAIIARYDDTMRLVSPKYIKRTFDLTDIAGDCSRIRIKFDSNVPPAYVSVMIRCTCLA